MVIQFLPFEEDVRSLASAALCSGHGAFQASAEAGIVKLSLRLRVEVLRKTVKLPGVPASSAP